MLDLYCSEVDRLMGCLLFAEDIAATQKSSDNDMDIELLETSPINEYFNSVGDCQKVWDQLIQDFREVSMNFCGLPKYDPLTLRYCSTMYQIFPKRYICERTDGAV